MLIIRAVIAVLILTGCLIHTAFSQSAASSTIKTLNVATGLPQSFISGLIQDSTGFIWIGTRDGLARYDGRKFKVFRHLPGDTTTLSDNIISGLYLDKEERLWIYYEAGDVDVLHTTTERLYHFTKDPLYKSVFGLLKSIFSFGEDKEGNAWMLNATGTGIFICNLDKRTCLFYTVAALGLGGHKIASLTSNKGNIILVTDNGLIKVNEPKKPETIVAYPFAPGLNNKVFTWKAIPIVSRKNGDVIILNHDELMIYKGAAGSLTTMKLPLLQETLNFCMTVDKEGQVFFDYGYSVYTLSSQDKLSLWKPNKDNPAYGFKSMLVDRSGVLWLGSNGKGIELCDLRLSHMAAICYKANFHEDLLQSFLQVPQQVLQKTSLYKSESYYVRWTEGLHKDLWFTIAGQAQTNTAKVYHYANGQLTTLPWRYTDTVTLQHVLLNSLAIDQAGKLWGVDFYLRPVYLDTLTHAVKVYPPLDSVNADYAFTVSSLFVDQDETFWISTPLNGLYYYNKKSNKTIHYTASGMPGALPTNQLMNIIQDPDEAYILWIGSLGGGLIRFNKSTGKCTIYTTKQGLPNNTVYAILPDARGILWCSSNKGIFSFDPKRNSVLQSFTSKDGLPGDEFNRYHFLKLPDGRMAFGGVDGYTVFDPLNIAKDNYEPQIALTGININNTAADFGDTASLFKQSINNLDKIKLPYDQNFLTFEFSALQYNITEKLQYRYMLDGFDKTWVNAGNENTATYTNIPPGHYVFRVNATNTAGKWSKNIKTLPVTIEPPFWRTWWFITSCILALIAFIYSGIKYRISSIRKEDRQKIEFERKASELEAQALRAQMNPHFIFNCLNSIKSLIHEDDKLQAITYLTTFSKLIRNQLNNAQQEVSLHDELETCRLYAELEVLRFGSQIVCEFEVDQAVDTLSLDVPPLIIQPFIENAIWHGILPKEGGKVMISVTKQDGDVVQCVIEDDGIGREVSMLNKSKQSGTYESKGMKLVKNRLNLYNTIHNYGGNLEVIDKWDKNLQAAGTKVIISFKKEV